jgi:hypothetical protein
LENPEHVAHLVVFEFQTCLFPVPLWAASDFEKMSFVVSKSVSVFQFLSNKNFETTSFAPLNRVLVVSNVGAEFASVFLVASVGRWVGMFALLFEEKNDRHTSLFLLVTDWTVALPMTPL